MPQAQPIHPINETIDTCKQKDSEPQTSPQIVYKSHNKGCGPSSPSCFQGLEAPPPAQFNVHTALFWKLQASGGQ